MGKLSGALSSVIFFGLFGLLVYFCCRVKRRGAVLRENANNFDNGAGVPVHQRGQPQCQPQHISGGLVGYPYPPQSYAPPTQHSAVYGPTTMPTVHGNSQTQPYPPYPMNNSSLPHSNLPYPVHGGTGGMPMPGIGSDSLQQSSAPYPMAPSAPGNEDYDKPPAYEDAIRQQ